MTLAKAGSAAPTSGRRDAGRRRVTLRVATIATAALVSGLAGPFGPGTAAAVSPATNFTELADSFATGGTVVLANDITQTGQALNVGIGQSVTLDLDGHTLSVTGVPSGQAAIGVPAGTTLIVEDTPGGGSITAVGGAGGAGIGGGRGANGVNSPPSGSVGFVGPAGSAGTVTGGNGLPGGTGNPGGTGGAGGAVAGTAPVATGGDGATGGNGTPGANGGSGGSGGSAVTTGAGGVGLGGNGGAGGTGGTGSSDGGAGGAGGAGASTSGVGAGGDGGDGGDGGEGAPGGAGVGTGVVTLLGGTITATGGSGGAGIGGGLGGNGDNGGNGGVGGAGGAGTGAGGTGIGGAGGIGGSGDTGGPGGTGGSGGTVTVLGEAVIGVTATGGIGAQDIGGGAGGTSGAGGTAGANGANGAAAAFSTPLPVSAVGAGAPGAQGASGTVAYGPHPPTGVSATAGHASAAVSFSAPSDTGSSAIISYSVTATDATDPSRGGQQQTGAGSPIIVGGLTKGDDYTFSVTATNGVGIGARSASSIAVTAADKPTTTGLVGSASPSAPGQTVTFTATVAPAPGGGAVTFAVDGTALAGCGARAVDPATGRATCQISSLTAGTHSVVAGYGGDAFHTGSTSAALTQSVVAAPAASLYPTDAVIIAGLEHVTRTRRSSRTLTFTQGIATKGTISWRLDVSPYVPKRSARSAARRTPIRLGTGGPTAATPTTIRHTIRLGARARTAIRRHGRDRLVLRTKLRLPNGRTIHATKTLGRARR